MKSMPTPLNQSDPELNARRKSEVSVMLELSVRGEILDDGRVMLHIPLKRMSQKLETLIRCEYGKQAELALHRLT